MKPAWSEHFEAGRLPSISPVRLPERITPEWAWGQSTGAGVKVAVIDSGIEEGHPLVGSVQGAVALEYAPDEPDQVLVKEGPHEDLYGHGTACAGLIRRVAPDAELHSVRVLGSRLSGKGVVFAAGLRWAIDHGMNVVNMSLSTGKQQYFSLFHELADAAAFRGVMLVGAANNVTAPSFPSLFSSVFSVASHDGTDPYRLDYNPNPPVEFGAPGIDVEVAWSGGSTITATGNSFAAPCIAGLITLVLAKHPGLTPFEVKTILRALASNTSATSNVAGDTDVSR